MQVYCDKHGYKLDAIEVPDYEKYDGLVKLQQIQNNLINDDDIVFSLDADCLITNFNKKVEDYIYFYKLFYVCEGFNMGSFIVKKSAWSEIFLIRMKALIKSGKCNCEQDAMEHLMNDERTDAKLISVLKHPAFNSYLSELYPEISQPVTEQHGQWMPHKSFILHVPALSIDDRVTILKEKLKDILYE